jgi:hypothetical protein
VSSAIHVYALILALGCTCVYGQTKTNTPEKITIILADGPLLVDEVTEAADGYWYKRGNMSKFLDRERVVGIERPKPPAEEASEEKVVEGGGKWRLTDSGKIEEFFRTKFKKPLPMSAFGQSELHTRWGWDHRNGMDVGLHPDSVEGRALIEFLRAESIPFLAFRGAVPGVATGPHIHVGNRSPRISGR